MQLAKEKNIKVEIRDTPIIFGDEQRIIAVFRNLLTNAMSYGADEIIVGYDKNQFYIKDNGIGISKNNIEKIFKPGERLKKIKTEGVGMGLSLCKKIIEMHKGNIWAKS